MTTQQLLKVNTSGKWESGLKTSISIREFSPLIVDEPKSLGGTDEGPNPVEYVLAGLSSCTSVMIGIISKEKSFSYQGVDFVNDGTLDLQGLMGVEGISPHFQNVNFDVIISTNEDLSRIEELKEEVEKRCPVYNLLIDAGVKVETNWIKK
ncbi:OsmC family protein [Paenisporosarcina antarctica]|uniref:OsmC family peroxiredoxin n=1 Tax=Paenisporosarcina antarctica TaxID=417367 RepID=A0A4P7A1E9_9BACL|nr:OsmC family protein [Paenisporosarcina antarctica]QBP42731.1 OsmC family peroxiredoxin [Paenisporosarcina antarctica]